MSTMERAPRLIEWTTPNDAAVTSALDRQRDLFGRWQEAQRLAADAQQRIASASHEHQERRGRALAAGKRDPGPFDATELQASANAAVDTAHALERGYALAREAALAVAEERQQEWVSASRDRLSEVARGMLEHAELLEADYHEWADAYVDVVLASIPSTRERPIRKIRAGVPPAPGGLDSWRALAAGTPERPVGAAVEPHQPSTAEMSL